MALVSNVPVSSEPQLEQVITSYIAQGFVVMSRSPTTATLFKKKEFSILWLVVGLVLCVFPLLIYLIIYASQSDQMVQVYLTDQASAPAAQVTSAVGQLSPDGRWRWDGTQWQPVAVQNLPAASTQDLPPAQGGGPPVS